MPWESQKLFHLKCQRNSVSCPDHWGDPGLVLHQFVDPKSKQLGEYEHHGQTVSTVPIIHCIMHYYIMGMKDGISL